MQKNFIGSGKMGTELESSTQNLEILISQTFKNSIGSAAEWHFSLPPVCHFFGRPDIHAVFVFNKYTRGSGNLTNLLTLFGPRATSLNISSPKDQTMLLSKTSV